MSTVDSTFAGSLTRRYFARTIDSIINVTLYITFFDVSTLIKDYLIQGSVHFGWIPFLKVQMAWLTITVLSFHFFQTSIGKKIFGLKVINIATDMPVDLLTYIFREYLMSIFCWVSGLTLSPSLIHTDRRHLFDFLLQTRCIQSKQRKKIPGKRYIIFSLLLLVSLNSLFRLVIYPTINLNGFNLNYYPSIKINTHKRIETFEELIKKTKERNLKKQAEELVKTSPVNPTSVSTVAPRETQEPTSNRNLVDNHSQKDTRETGLSLDEIERNLNNFNNIQKTAPSHNTSQRKKTANDGLDNF